MTATVLRSYGDDLHGWVGGRTGEVAQPKTDRARRTLLIGTGARAALREQRRRQLEERSRLAPGQDRDLVFTNGTGGPLDSRNVTQSLQAALARAGLPRQRFHDLRHAHATLMLEDGEELAILSRSLGHADLSTRADVYAHLTTRMQERSAARMDAILEGTREAASGWRGYERGYGAQTKAPPGARRGYFVRG